MIPGIEIDTERGHVLALCPEPIGRTILEELSQRVPIIVDKEASFDSLINSLSQRRTTTATYFRDHLVLIGAHADAENSILTARQPPSVDNQANAAGRLDAIEVVRSDTLATWSRGIKQTSIIKPLLRGSDFHPYANHEARSTWLYLPELDIRSLKHALATYEASVSHEDSPPNGPDFWIKSIRFEGGLYDGRHITFSPRANALIGPPSSGKSLLVDAIRFAFDQSSELADVQTSVDRRLTRCLPPGSTVVLEVSENGIVREMRRTRGGTVVPTSQDYPISFSQSELARRAMEQIPSVDLLDLHCPDADRIRGRIADIASAVETDFQRLVKRAGDANVLRAIVDNKQEGLEATRAAYRGLVGDDENADSLKDLGSIELWHEESAKSLSAWREAFQVPPGPTLATLPVLDTTLDITKYVPEDVVVEPLRAYNTDMETAADKLQERVRDAMRALQPNVAVLRDEVESKLGSGQDASSEVLEKASQLKNRLVQLQQQFVDLTEADEEIKKGIAEIANLVDNAHKQWLMLRAARKTACSEVNRSMVGFFVRLTEDSQSDDLDELLKDLRTGTHLQEQTLNVMRDSLDRGSFVSKAIRSAQFASGFGNESLEVQPNDNVARVAKEAMSRSKHKQIAELAVTWPDDGIDLVLKGDGGATISFDGLTEGLKALAIKEISLAASQRPAVTDQPEDAVPTTAVFEKLVPTIRKQRASRQFIVASHDANVVVSGDMESVIVLPAEPMENPTQGTLFDSEIRVHAVNLLEGGESAFRLRRERYGEHERE